MFTRHGLRRAGAAGCQRSRYRGYAKLTRAAQRRSRSLAPGTTVIVVMPGVRRNQPDLVARLVSSLVTPPRSCRPVSPWYSCVRVRACLHVQRSAGAVAGWRQIINGLVKECV